MAHFAIVCPEDAGHLLSIGSVGIELVLRGHRVTIIGRAQAAPVVEQLNLPLHVLKLDDVPWPSAVLTWLAFSLVGAGWKIGLRNAFCWRARAILEKLPAVLRDLDVDGVIADQIVSAAGTAAARAGVPFVTVCSALLWNEEIGVPPPFTGWPYAQGRTARWRNYCGYAGWRWYMRPVLAVINRYRTRWRLAPFARISDTYSPLAQISQLCAEFDFPRYELPSVFHYVGSLAANRQANIDDGFPWERLDGRPLVFASLGTIPEPVNVPVFRKIAEACAGVNAQLVLALGRWTEKHDSLREKLGTLPGNHLVVDFAPQLALLDKAALLITHAGVNTVLEAITRGVPMVALPRNADQPGMGSRIEHAGIGLRAPFHRCTPEGLRRLIVRMLTDDRFRQRAKGLQQAMIAAGGAQRAADIAEEALTTGRPVLRPCGSLGTGACVVRSKPQLPHEKVS
jgi:MGT family glycosyltransferase